MTAAWNLVRESFQEFQEDRASSLAAALAYYTVFSLAPLLVIVLAVAGLFFDQAGVREQLLGQLADLVGQGGADFIAQLLDGANREGSGLVATLIGAGVLVLGATGVFAQLQASLNAIWHLKAKPSRSWLHLVKIRLLSFGMVIVIGFLLLVSLVASTALQAVNTYFSSLLPGSELLWQLLSLVVNLGVITLLFALIFKVLPDARIAWRTVWVGAAITALLFVLGKYVISLYLGSRTLGTTYGAAASLVVLLLWVYYSAQILLFGAEVTQVYARQRGERVEPNDHALRVGSSTAVQD